jgi:hypothetical protein
MPELFACLINKDADRDAMLAVATEFAYRIELLGDGILFDVSGLEKLIGTPAKITAAILETMESHRINGNLAVDANLEKAILLARHGKRFAVRSARVREAGYLPLFDQLPLTSLPLESEVSEIFQQLGLREIRDLQKIPTEDLIARYGRNFIPVLNLINESPRRTLIPNLKDDAVFWESELETEITGFEQLMFLIEHVLTELFAVTLQKGYSTELIEIYLLPDNETAAGYEVKASRPTLDKTFWLKLIYLRLSTEPPAAAIKYVKVTVRFTRPRPTAKGLFAVTRPEPENLLLTINKLKKLLGKENVGVPVLLNQRLPEPFELNTEKMPTGIERKVIDWQKPLVGFS